MKKGFLVTIIIILVVGAGIVVGFNMQRKGVSFLPLNYEMKNNNINDVDENKIVNEILNDITNEIKNNNNETENVTTQNTTSTETFKSDAKTDIEKAKDIVKNDCKKLSNVSIAEDTMVLSDNKIVLKVVDSNTSQLLYRYTVDVSNGTFTKKEMY